MPAQYARCDNERSEEVVARISWRVSGGTGTTDSCTPRSRLWQPRIHRPSPDSGLSLSVDGIHFECDRGKAGCPPGVRLNSVPKDDPDGLGRCGQSQFRIRVGQKGNGEFRAFDRGNSRRIVRQRNQTPALQGGIYEQGEQLRGWYQSLAKSTTPLRAARRGFRRRDLRDGVAAIPRGIHYTCCYEMRVERPDRNTTQSRVPECDTSHPAPQHTPLPHRPVGRAADCLATRPSAPNGSSGTCGP